MATAIFDTDFEKAHDAMIWHPLTQGIAIAIAEERERCAKLAEQFNAAGKPIAAAIRRG